MINLLTGKDFKKDPDILPLYYIAIHLLSFIETDSESSSHPIERDGKFLWIKKKTDNVSNELARVHSTEYQNSASSCIIRFIFIYVNLIK